MKFLVFSDYHYAPGFFKSHGFEGLDVFRTRALNSGCDMIIHAGDLCHDPISEAEFVNAYNSFPIPTYHCLGNHDTDGCALEDTLRLYKMPAPYYSFDVNGYRFIVACTSYYEDGGEYIAYTNGNYYKHPDGRETLPPEQLQFIENAISDSPYPCVIISHASFERCDGVKNREALRDIIIRCNTRRKNSVLMFINGHHHRDNIRILDNVIYFEMNSASFDWIGAAYEHRLYPEEECKRIKHISKTVCYDDPLHAIVTLEGNTVTIEGIESSMYLGVTRKMTGAPEYDNAGRPVTPCVQSAKITLS